MTGPAKASEGHHAPSARLAMRATTTGHGHVSAAVCLRSPVGSVRQDSSVLPGDTAKLRKA